MKTFFALAAFAVAAGCSKPDNVDRRIDSIVTPPVAVEPPSPATIPSVSLDCAVTGTPVITGEGIGELKKGRKVADVKTVCETESDSEELGPEGMKERVLVVRIAGESVRAIVTNDRIWRIEIFSPLYRTDDSLGVDTPLRRIARMPGAQFFPGEGGVYGFIPEHCGISFRFSVPLRPPKAGNWTAASIDKAHGDAAVDRVLLTGCDH